MLGLVVGGRRGCDGLPEASDASFTVDADGDDVLHASHVKGVGIGGWCCSRREMGLRAGGFVPGGRFPRLFWEERTGLMSLIVVECHNEVLCRAYDGGSMVLFHGYGSGAVAEDEVSGCGFLAGHVAFYAFEGAWESVVLEM